MKEARLHDRTELSLVICQ